MDHVMPFDCDLFERTIPEILMRSAERTPDKDAFICGTDRKSYADMVHAMRQLAGVLRDQAVKRGDRIAILMHQSLHSAVAIYGTMHAGAAFVPIDPNSPLTRIQAILEKCDIRVVITHEAKRQTLLALLGQEHGIEVVIGLDDLPGVTCIPWTTVETAPAGDGPFINSGDLSYIMWTSGSTGDPKGMTHVHRNGLIYAGMLSETHGLCASDRFLGLSPLHFDMSVMDYIAAPLVGATTIIVPEAVAKLPAALTRLAAQERASIMYTVPFAMTQMLTQGAMEKHDLTALRWMIYGGENFPPAKMRDLMKRLPGARFANAFGPAETHQISSYTLPGPPRDDALISVGRPWRTLEALIVDAEDRPVAPGEAGELLVRSPSAMLGYWKDPDRTDEAFFRRPMDGGLEQVFYRTGDVVRQDDQGLMYFLGRIGRQIKLRGFRIELDEVEAALASAPGVHDCAVITDAGKTQLLGFVQTTGETPPNRASLIDRCRAKLPPQAVPAEIYIVAGFPRTGSGKIDKEALLGLVGH